MTTHVLILCTHNSARSVLGEGMLNHWAHRLGKAVSAFSAGSAPSGRVNPQALESLAGAGMATAGFRSKSWDEFAASGAPAMRIVQLTRRGSSTLRRRTCCHYASGATG